MCTAWICLAICVCKSSVGLCFVFCIFVGEVSVHFVPCCPVFRQIKMTMVMKCLIHKKKHDENEGNKECVSF